MPSTFRMTNCNLRTHIAVIYLVVALTFTDATFSRGRRHPPRRRPPGGVGWPIAEESDGILQCGHPLLTAKCNAKCGV